MEKADIKPVYLGDEVIDLEFYPFGDRYSEKDYNPKEITPEQLKDAIKESEEKLKKAFKKRLESLKNLYGGKEIRKSTYDLKDEAPYMFQYKTEEIAETEYPEDFNEMKRFVKEVEEFKNSPIPEDRALKSIEIDFETEGYDEDDCEVYRVYATVEWVFFTMPNEKNFKKAVEINALYKIFSPIFKYDCEAVKEFLEGDLTFKGLVRRLNPFRKESC